MTPEHRNRIRTRTAAGLTTVLLTLLIASALHHPGHLTSILLILTAALGATTATLALALALAAAFALTTATRTAARHTSTSCCSSYPGTHPEVDDTSGKATWMSVQRSGTDITTPAQASRSATIVISKPGGTTPESGSTKIFHLKETADPTSPTRPL
ncbi:hypothetical protein ACFU5B_37430 [Streptomyces murinus]|uniref:hypothetical protein n=1 Tax=Streptomyces murinus TaxID=33900 RepID=UPI003632BAC0